MSDAKSYSQEQLVTDLQGVRVDSADEDGFTALMLAVLKNKGDIKGIVTLLLDLGADCDLENHNGETALFLALIEKVRFLTYTSVKNRRKPDYWLCNIAAPL